MPQPTTGPAPGATNGKPRQPFKRLVVLSDGTWQSLSNEVPTNVMRIATSLSREDASGVQQLVFYDPGVGTNNGPVDRVLGGAMGEGIDKNIKQLYTSLALNYDDGDEVYLFGFSRGAYTVRSLAGFIYEAGLVRRSHVHDVDKAYELYRGDHDHDSDVAKDFRDKHGQNIPIKCLACFDTVGALGLPFSGPLSNFDNARYEFHDPHINPDIENAIHMCSIEEERSTFSPTMMKAHPSCPASQLTQLFFWGTHGGVGGGEPLETEQSAISFHFLLTEMKRRKLALEFDESAYAVPSGGFDTRGPIKQRPRRGPVGMVIGAITGIAGRHVRKVPGPDVVHPSVIDRYGHVDKWRPAALQPIKAQLLEASAQEPKKTEA